MRFFNNDYDDIMVPDYAEHLKSDTFNSLTEFINCRATE